MFKIIQIVFFLFFIKQFDCFTLRNITFYDEARDLLIKIKLETSQATLEYTNNMDPWINHVFDSQDAFNSKIQGILDKKMNETTIKLNEAEKEAESKGPDAVLCIIVARQSLDSLREVADFYLACAQATLSGIELEIGMGQQEVNHLSDEIYDVDAKFLGCGTDEKCFEELIPVLEQTLVDLPAKIRARIQDVDADVKDATDGNLEATCDTSKEFETGCDKLISDVQECINEA